MKRYSGSRDLRFVAIHRGSDLDLETHRSLVKWAADCAEHVLHLYIEVYPSDARPKNAITIAREWAIGNATVDQARQASFAAHHAVTSSAAAHNSMQLFQRVYSAVGDR